MLHPADDSIMLRGMPELHPITAQLLADIEKYRDRAGIDRTHFGIEAAGDGNFIRRIERGQIPRIPTIDRVYAYMGRHGKTARRLKPALVRAP
jgi:predicted transcriptional regulator